VDIKTIDLNGQTIRVAVRPGLKKTTPLLMFNGIGASLELVLPFVRAMRPDLEVIAFDVPGVGGSSTPLLPYRFSGLTKIVTQMLDHLDYGQVDVIGLSWGGFLAQQFAHDYPQRCRRLILAATSAGIISFMPSWRVLCLMASPRRYTDPAYAASIAPSIYGGKFRYDKALAAIHAEKMAEDKANHAHRSSYGYYYQVAAVYWWSSLPWLHKLKQPTLVLAGNDDPLIPLTNMKVLALQIPNSEFHVFNDGHLFLLTDLDRVLPIIDEFLNRPAEMLDEHELDAVPLGQAS
jgi:poly(3-hydroxyalkanoate) depolymerase